MQAETLSVDPFSTDWLAMAASDEARGVDCTASSNDPLAFLDDGPLGPDGAQADSLQGGDTPGGASTADLSAWLGAYSASMDGAAGGGAAVPPSMYSQSDMEASPFALSETSFSGASSLGYSNGTDLSSLFEPSSPFASGSLFGSGAAASFASDFDANALQALFAPVSGQAGDFDAAGGGGQDGSQAAARSQGIPLQAVSPASTTAGSFSPHAPPPPYLSPSNASAVDFSLAVSPPAAAAATSPSFQATPDSGPSTLTRSGVAITSEQRPFTSLAAAAGIVVPPVAGSSSTAPHAYAGQASLAIAQEASTAAKLGRASGGSTRGRTAAQPRVAVRPIAPNPVGTIANAGLKHEVHASAPYQLIGDGTFRNQPLPMSRTASTTSVAGRPRRGAAAKQDVDEEEPMKGATGGRKGRKKAEGGHNAVEQKYRNSINSALAALRDNIPALSHLKPLPSMPTTKRKASQFSLASAAIPETPEGLIDGIPAARTLSKGVILNKAVEYIDFLRYSRDAQNEDIETLKSMVREMVGDGAKLVDEFEQRQAARHLDREAERKRLLAEDSQEEQGDSGEEDEDEEAPVVQAPKGRAGAAGTKRGRPATTPAAPAKKARSSARTNALTPPLSEEYERVQDLNAAHLGALAAHESANHPSAHAFPPSPVSSEDRGVSPSALGTDAGGTGRGGRVMLASFMGASFAGGLGYDLAASAAVAEETIAQAAGRAWAGGLIRRSEGSEPTVPAQVTMLHPALLSGLVALGAACVVIGLFYLVRSIINLGKSTSSPAKSRRSRAMAALQVISARPSATYGAARKNALDARRALLRLVGGPSVIVLPFAIAKEAVVWAIRRVTGLTWGRDGAVDEQATIEEAMAWIRIAEIETMVGWKIPYLARAHTFLRLSNLSRAPTWPYVSPTTSRPAVDALISMHLLSLGHAGGAEATWSRMVARRKKSDATGDSFVNVAVAADFDDVRERMSPTTRVRKSFDESADPSDTVPLLYMAEAACEAALEDVWANTFIAVVTATAGAGVKGGAPSIDSVYNSVHAVGRIVADGSELHSLVNMTDVFLTIFRLGSSASSTAGSSLAAARNQLARLALEAKSGGPLSRLFCTQAFFELLAPTLSGSADGLSSLLPAPTAREPTSKIDLFATTVFAWLICRRSASAPVDKADAATATAPGKADRALHARAIAARHLLGHARFRSTSDEGREHELDEVDEAFEEARDVLVDALTLVARKAAGIASALDEDSGVELDW
ncbi:hypothetical protein JCM3774_002059 [Rhodotorula dairenensis]